MKMDSVVLGHPYHVGDGECFIAHRFYVQMQTTMGMIDFLNQFDGFRRTCQKICFDGAQWLERKSDPHCLSVLSDFLKQFRCAFDRISFRPVALNHPLFGGSPDHDSASQCVADIYEVTAEIQRFLSDHSVGGCDMHSRWLE